MKVCPRCKLEYPNENERCFVDREVLEPMPDQRIGTTLKGRYLVEGLLGEGGMAMVYRARSTLVDQEVAVKIMNPQLARDPSLRERFRREAKNAAALAHPNIIAIYDHGETDDGTTFLVMELLDGVPLSALIERGPMPPTQVAAIGLQIAQGLARAHDFDVLHRDLKPDNVFVCGAGEGRPLVKLLDFGIARSMHDPRLTHKGEVFGTPQYMAPERVTSIDSGREADLYALGVILFEMLTGRLPFESDDLMGFLLKHMQEAPPRPSALVPQCPRRLEELILALLAKKPEERPVDAHQVIKELAALAPTQGRDSHVPPLASSAGRQAAPTLPPTTLERWANRTAIFDRMIARAHPRGAPPEVAHVLEQIRAALARIHDLRAAGLREQRKLEAMAANANEGRERLGRAVNTLAEDLSNARQAARTAQQEVEPYFQAEAQAESGYRAAHAEVAALGGYRELEAPRDDLAGVLRHVVDALDRWVLARGAADKARRWTDAKAADVQDLEFQVQALRAQLERLEVSYEQERDASEQRLVHDGRLTEELERGLVPLATRLCDPLRARSDLQDLFAQLEGAA